MKIRNGWVSNSSSSSFIICGVSLPCSIIDEEENEKELKEFLTDEAYHFLEENDFDAYEFSDVAYREDGDGESYLGISPENYFEDDNMTIGEIKKKAAAVLEKVVRNFDPGKIHFFTGGGYIG